MLFTLIIFLPLLLMSCSSSIISNSEITKLLDHWFHNSQIGANEQTILEEYLLQTVLNIESGWMDQSEVVLLRRIGIMLSKRFSGQNSLSTERYVEWLTVKIPEIEGLEELVIYICSENNQSWLYWSLRVWTRICVNLLDRNQVIESIFHRWLNCRDCQQDSHLVADSLRWLFRRVETVFEMGAHPPKANDLSLLKEIGTQLDEGAKAGIVQSDRMLARIHSVAHAEEQIAGFCLFQANLSGMLASYLISSWEHICSIVTINRWLDEKPLLQLGNLAKRWAIEGDEAAPSEDEKALLVNIFAVLGRIAGAHPEEGGRLLRIMFSSAEVGEAFEWLCNGKGQKMIKRVEHWPILCGLIARLGHIKRFVAEIKRPKLSAPNMATLAKRVGSIFEAAFLSPFTKDADGILKRVGAVEGVRESIRAFCEEMPKFFQGQQPDLHWQNLCVAISEGTLVL